MTQEELDALMNGDVDLDALEEETTTDDSTNTDENTPEDIGPLDPSKDDAIYPPPATDDHKVVSQLDEVTKESEEKATEILDIMDQISNAMMDNEEYLNKVLDFLNAHKELFEKLSTKFSHIKIFEEEKAKIEEMIELVNQSIENSQGASDNIMMAMDIMQFQDIHRQKIERVINIMRELLKYMNKIFEGKIDDTKRVSSARHIHGDSTEDVVEEDDLEALIAQFAGKK
jgi:chemotaxis regulatin CheY-phosphate phosphatase CheZ